jgi:hypothetical protein
VELKASRLFFHSTNSFKNRFTWLRAENISDCLTVYNQHDCIHKRETWCITSNGFFSEYNALVFLGFCEMRTPNPSFFSRRTWW